MAIDLLDEFASSGTKTEPTANKKAEGFSGGEQPAADEANWLFNAWTKKINEIAQKADPSPATIETSNIIQKYYPPTSTWSSMDDTQNKISLPTGKAHYELAMYLTSSGEKRILAMRISTDRVLDIIDPETMAVIDTSDELGTELPYSVLNPWMPLAFCTDGTSVYVVFGDGDDPANYRISAYNISDWNLKSGWPSSGAVLPGSGVSGYTMVSDGAYPAKIIFADSSTLAVLCPWNTVTASNSGAVCFVDVDNTLSSFTAGTHYGAGDASTSSSINGINGITSDGTNVYYIGWGSTDSYLCSVSIADPTSGNGNTGYPYTFDATDGYPIDLITTGSMLVVGLKPSTNDLVLYACTPDSAYGAEVTRVTSSPGVDQIWTIGRLIFDGFNVWARARTKQLAGYYMEYLVRLNVERLCNDTSSSTALTMSNIIDDYAIACYSFDPQPDTSDASSPMDGVAPVLFDGRDLWALHSFNPSSEYDGLLRRLPLAAFR